MSDVSEQPDWLGRARSLWKSKGVPPGLNAKWSPVWITRFLDYLEKSNNGRLPRELPSYSAASAFESFLANASGAESWKIEQARRAVDWLLDAGGSHAAIETAEIPSRRKVEQAGKALDWFGVAAGFGGMLKIWYPKGCEGRVVLLNR